MKKTLVLLAAILYFNLAVKAQTTEQIVSNFKTLLAEAASDFKNVKGTVLENDSSHRTVYYKCAKTLGSSFEAICVNSNDNTSYFSSKFEHGLSGQDELAKGYTVLQAVLDVLKPMLKSGNYKGGQYEQGKKTLVELKDLDGNYIVETELLPESTGNETSHIKITIYGKSWGKK
ncbi:hypothetical protein [Ferruginibacter sp.]|nr:hypothetical protein [Ferruginibacter sp.]